jgi:hypothetical protein
MISDAVTVRHATRRNRFSAVPMINVPPSSFTFELATADVRRWLRNRISSSSTARSEMLSSTIPRTHLPTAVAKHLQRASGQIVAATIRPTSNRH